MFAGLDRQVRATGLELSGSQVDQLAAHLGCVLSAAGSMNLTAIRDPDAAIRLHVADSLLAAPLLSQAPQGSLLDIGSGAGYPGIPLAIVSHRQTTLLEATRKKCVFLEDCVTANRLAAVEVCCGRAEELALRPELRNAFAATISRAVADLPILLELSAPFLVEGGLALSMKGRLTESELERGDAAAEIVGLRRLEVKRYALPGGDEERAIAVYERWRDPSIALPRRTGMPKRKPLG